MSKIKNITILFSLCVLLIADDTRDNSYNNRYFTSENGVLMNVNVWGAVRSPGLHSVPEGIDFPGLMSIVGGPINGAKLKTIKRGDAVLTIDSNVGQNVINQALEFNKFLPIDSLILTKMDGTARGGIAVSLINQLDIPINFIGVGESIDDLVPFDLDAYLNGLILKESQNE